MWFRAWAICVASVGVSPITPLLAKEIQWICYVEYFLPLNAATMIYQHNFIAKLKPTCKDVDSKHKFNTQTIKFENGNLEGVSMLNTGVANHLCHLLKAIQKMCTRMCFYVNVQSYMCTLTRKGGNRINSFIVKAQLGVSITLSTTSLLVKCNLN